MTTATNVCVFDAYGTLFDLHSATARYAEEVGPQAMALSQLWRNKQIEYSWIRSAMARMPDGWRDFWSLTEEALTHAMAVLKVESPGLREKLLGAYMTLDAYPDARATLTHLKARNAGVAILSNGSPNMLAAAVQSAGIAALCDALLSVDAVRMYKPRPEVYALVTARFGVKPQDVVFVSSNRWDVMGAASFGFRPVWVNRSGIPDEYLDHPPAKVVADLTQLQSLKF